MSFKLNQTVVDLYMSYKKLYDRVGKLHGWDFSKIQYTCVDNSEFKYFEEINKVLRKTDLVLDVGTGGGEKALKYLNECGFLIGIDNCEAMVAKANENLKDYPDKRACFLLMSSARLKFPEGFFDVILVRHSCISARENYRCLKNGGYMFSEDIDETDCLELKKLFGRGQGFTTKEKLASRTKKDLEKCNFDFRIYEIIQNEFYKTADDLLFLLYNTPIIPNFGKNEHDFEMLEKYIAKNTTEKGIYLNRRLFGIIARKR